MTDDRIVICETPGLDCRVLVGESVFEDAELTVRDGHLYVEFTAEDLDDISVDLRALAPPTEAQHRPRRDDDVETWLKRMRDRNSSHPEYPHAIDGLLDRYRECADYGLTLRPEDDSLGDP